MASGITPTEFSPQEWMNVGQASEYLDISTDTFRRLVKVHGIESTVNPNDNRERLYLRSRIVSLKQKPVDIQSRHRVITISNNKGGVGKTTTCVSLASEAAFAGHKVLVIDAAPQASATKALVEQKDFNTAGEKGTLLSWLRRNEEFQDLISTLQFGNVSFDIIKGSSRNDQIDRFDPLETLPALQEQLENWDDSPYDFIFIDTDPSFGILSSMAQISSHFVLGPVVADVMSMDGTYQLITQLKRARNMSKTSFPFLLGFVITRYDGRKRMCREARDYLISTFPDTVFDIIIPENVRVAESPGHLAPVFFTAPESTGAQAYRALWKEVEARINKISNRT